MAIKGLNKVLASLKKREAELAKGCQKGLKLVGVQLLEDAQYIVPIDTQDLYNSGSVRTEGGGTGFDTKVAVGYTDWKAVMVHEDPDKAHGEEFNIKYAAEIAAGKEHARRPQEQYKFLTTPLNKNRNDYYDIFISAMKL